jgi:hypothetical protein
MKIKKIDLSHLRNETHYQFFNLFRDLLGLFPYIMSLITELYQQLIILLDRESQLVDAERSSDLSKPLAEADRKIDEIVIGINNLINAGLYHFDQQVRAAAKILKSRMKDFGSISSKPYEEEAAAVKLLISDLNGKHAQQRDLLGLREWVDQLAVAENEFDTIFKQRNLEFSEKPDYNLRKVRKEIDVVYQQITERIDAAAVSPPSPPSPEFDAFIRQLNEEINYTVEHSGKHARKDLAAGDHTVFVPVDTQTFTGKPINIIPTVYFREEGKPTVELVFTKDFTVSYKNNINVGTANIIIHGKGKYKGQKILTFNIEKQL